MSFDYFIAYYLILFVATITPGPSMLLAVNHGVNHGIAKTIYSGIGNLIGNLLMALVSIVGLGVVLVASGIVFNIIKWIGIIYLLYIGLKLIIQTVKNNLSGTKLDNLKSKSKKRYRLFLDGFIVAIGNPKGILFFTALFPQFINKENATLTGFLIILATLAVVALGCFMIYAVFGAKLNRVFHLPSFRKIFNRITGAILIGTGLTLAFSKK
jgi:homoserine/homoserine lactone efflux protein